MGRMLYLDTPYPLLWLVSASQFWHNTLRRYLDTVSQFWHNTVRRYLDTVRQFWHNLWEGIWILCASSGTILWEGIWYCKSVNTACRTRGQAMGGDDVPWVYSDVHGGHLRDVGSSPHLLTYFIRSPGTAWKNVSYETAYVGLPLHDRCS